MLFREMTAVYYDNHTELINTVPRQSAELLNVKTHGTYIYHLNLWAIWIRISYLLF
jgi:hypothetical protein